jgi:phosphatidate cytidylyltransferase
VRKIPKLVERLLVFFIGVPLVLCMLLLLPQKRHLVINIAIIAISALGGMEFADFLKKKNPRAALSPVSAALLGMAAPLSMTLAVSFNAPISVIAILITALVMWLIVSRTFVAEDKLNAALDSMAAGFAVILYPGFFIAWITAMMRWPHEELASMIVLVFLLIAFGNDSAAWAFGVLLGKGNQGFIKASPNKSIAGFAGGLAASIGIGVGAAFLIPTTFAAKALPASFAGLILGLATGIAASVGDLGESAMKRSANIKDSGALIPGRGGVLDSVDSICFAAPVYYIVYWLLFV